MEELVNQLHEAIYQKESAFWGKSPTLIVMHPATFIEIEKILSFHVGDASHHTRHFRGIPVLRSVDVAEGEFKIAYEDLA